MCPLVPLHPGGRAYPGPSAHGCPCPGPASGLTARVAAAGAQAGRLLSLLFCQPEALEGRSGLDWRELTCLPSRELGLGISWGVVGALVRAQA